jgi:CRISPR-associated exonuclease Cas4
MIYLAGLLLLTGALLLWLATRRERIGGLPGGKIIYSDAGRWNPPEKPLYDAESGLAGKPDYLVEQSGKIIPVEVKTGRRQHLTAYDSHIYQLAAYCLLVERSFGARPPYGILHYAGESGETGQSYRYDYTPALEQALHALLDEMHLCERRRKADRSHDSPARCRGCGFRAICDQRLQST